MTTDPSSRISLLCLDLEAGSRELARYAAARAQQCQQSILLLHVTSPQSTMQIDEIRPQLEEIANTLLGGVEVEEIVIEQGVAEDQIVEAAQRYAVNTIIIGRRKRPTIERIYVGSTTSAVLSLAGTAVLVVPLTEAFGVTD